MKTVIPSVFALVAIFATFPIGANEPANSSAGGSIADKIDACAQCHGQNGDEPLAAEYPILANQYPSYLANSLRQYRDGQRNNPIMVMQFDLLKLTESDIEALSEHFGSKSSKLHSLADD
ncbi:MAG: cytochrome c553 [Gammaproteobacteria bacterium]|jgi:cytochrome c553